MKKYVQLLDWAHFEVSEVLYALIIAISFTVLFSSRLERKIFKGVFCTILNNFRGMMCLLLFTVNYQAAEHLNRRENLI